MAALYQNLSPKLEDMIIACKWQNRPVNCSQYFQSILTDRGQCYTFQSLQFVEEFGTLHSQTNHIEQGLSLILDTTPNDTFVVSTLLNGFSVLINDVKLVPMSDGQELFVGPGHQINIGLIKETYERLNPPYAEQECVAVDAEYSDLELVSGYRYSKSGCQSACLKTRSEEQCGCAFTSPNTSSECTYAQYWECLSYETALQEFTHCSSTCKDSCSTVAYDTRVNMAAFPDPTTVRLAHLLQFPVTEEEEIRKRMLQLNVYYVTLDEKHVTQHPRYKSLDIFSTIGGLMGLCLGVSLISVLELCDFLLGCTMIPLARKPDIDSSTI